MTKSSLVQRLKKYKKEVGLSYESLSKLLGFKSPMTSHKWITKKAIPKKHYNMLNSFLSDREF